MQFARHRIFFPRETGVAALLSLFVLLVGVAGWLVSGLSSARFEIEQDTQTATALARAKETLIGRAAADPNLPGALSCPDVDNDGDADTTTGGGGIVCGTAASPNIYLGRLPWRTLGLPDLRDGTGERLWYAVSQNFRDSPGTVTINSDTAGQLIVTGTTPATNVVAIVFSPGPTLSFQVRTAANINVATHHLEGENANGPPNYVTGTTSATFNDRALTIVPDELFAVVEKRVVKEVERALNDYYTLGSQVFPQPATFTEFTCLGIGPITTGCGSAPVYQGRIPANPTPGWTPSANVANLDGGNGNWFQANRWREVVYYAVAPACTEPANPSCAGSGGFLTLNVPPGTLNNQKVVVMAAGRARSPAQVRGSNLEKTTLSNYVELENANGDNTYVRDAVSVNLNDRVVSIP